VAKEHQQTDDQRADELETTDPELLPDRELMSIINPEPQPIESIADVTPPPPGADN
jgi:hypothetical protein